MYYVLIIYNIYIFHEIWSTHFKLLTACLGLQSLVRFIPTPRKTHNHASPNYFITPPAKRHIKPADKSVVFDGLYYIWLIVDIFDCNLSAEQSFSAWAIRKSKPMLDKSRQYSRRRICIYTYNLHFLDRHISEIILYISSKLGAGSE